MQHKYTDDQIAWLKRWYPRFNVEILTKLFNRRFDACVTNGGIKATLVRHKITSGRTGRFINGSIPFNKGMKGFRYGLATEFKPGNKPHNTLPIGYERVRSDGYLWVKIAEPNKWRQKHVLVWEQHNGPKQPGHAVIFKDQNKQHIIIENLMLVERKLLLQINRNGYAKTPDTIKPSIIALSSLEIKMQRLKSGKHHAKPTQHA